MEAAQPQAAEAVTMAVPTAAVPKGTAFEPESARLSVLSYNLLAPIYVRPIDRRTGAVQAFAAFDWAEPAAEVLEWGVRWPRLLAELLASAADIICLQEVQFERGAGGQYVLPAWLAPLSSAESAGYSARLPPQADLKEMAERNERVLGVADAPVGNALLLRTRRLSLLEPEPAVRPGAKAIKDASVRSSASPPPSRQTSTSQH